MRDIESLIAVDGLAWPHLQKALAESEAIALSVAPEQGQRSLWELQVTAASMMGAVALHTGGIVAEHGWVRLYGGGSESLPSIAKTNGLGGSVSAPPGALIVGHDVLGGLFAIDGGALGVSPGEVCYFGPDPSHGTGSVEATRRSLWLRWAADWGWSSRGCAGLAGKTRWRRWRCHRAFPSTLRRPPSKAET